MISFERPELLAQGILARLRHVLLGEGNPVVPKGYRGPVDFCDDVRFKPRCLTYRSLS